MAEQALADWQRSEGGQGGKGGNGSQGGARLALRKDVWQRQVDDALDIFAACQSLSWLSITLGSPRCPRRMTAARMFS